MNRAPSARRRARVGLLLFALVVACAPLAAWAQEPLPPDPDATTKIYLPTVGNPYDVADCVCAASMAERNGRIVPDQYIVIMSEGEARAAGGFVPTATFAADLIARYGGELLYTYDQALDGFAAVLPAAAVESLRGDPRVATIEPDRYVVLDLPDADTLPAAPKEGAAPQGAGRQEIFASNGNSILAAGGGDTLTDFALDPALDGRLEESAPVEDLATTDGFPTEAFPTEALAIEWGLDRIDQRGLPLNNRYTPTGHGSGVHIYIIDTGLRSSHAQFAGRVGAGRSFINDGLGTTDCNGHGTHVAGSAAGATFGVARRAIIHPVRVLDRCGSGTNSGVAAGINWVKANAIKPAVANMSLGSGSSETAIDQAVASAISSGITFVVAAGNEADAACRYTPARVAAAITVGATGSNDGMAGFSNFGSCVDIMAPGNQIRSAWHTGDASTGTISGTSMASPHVAGAAAILLGSTPSMTPAQVATALRNSATVGRLSTFGAGTPNRLLYVGSGAQPPATSCTNFIANGGFEQGRTVWTRSSTHGFETICTQTNCDSLSFTPRTGSWLGWLGGDDDESSVMRQTVSAPAGRNAILGFWYRIASNDGCGYDFATVAVKQGSAVLDRWVFSLCSAASAPAWQYAELAVPEAAGRSVQVELTTTTDYSLPSSFWMDDIRFISGNQCVLAAAE